MTFAEKLLERDRIVEAMVAAGQTRDPIPVEIPGSPMHSWTPPHLVRRADGTTYYTGGVNTPSGLLPGEEIIR